MRQAIFVILCLYLVCAVAEGRKDGNPCYHKHKKMNGVCKTRKFCPSFYEDLANKIKVQKCSRKTYCCAVKASISVLRTSVVQQNATTVGQKSQEMCKKYEELAMVSEEALTLSFAPPVKTIECPRDYSNNLVIIGGELANKGEFPHMALIGYGKQEIKWGCGGSLVSDRHVLTAAHCLRSLEYGNPVKVRLGDLNITDPFDSEYVQEIPIKMTHKHSDYVYPSTYNDIAIFELEFPANLSVYVKPICIYTEDTLPRHVIATGWGDTENSTKGKNDALMKVALDVYNSSRCLETFPPDRKYYRVGFNQNIQICAGSPGKNDTCQGDSGGPIQINNNKVACSYYIIGITSHGKADCGSENIPAVYVKIFPYIEWIESIIWSEL